MSRSLTRIVFALTVSLMATSCATYARHGDAVLENNGPSFPLAAVDRLNLPKTALGKRAVYSYKVAGLPQEIYPQGFELEIPESEDSRWLHNQPWRNCIIEASLTTLDGDVFFKKRLNFAHDWNGGSDPGGDSDRRKIYFPFTDYDYHKGKSTLPPHLSYTLRLEIIRPSLRPTDQLEVQAYTILSQNKAKL